MGDGVGVRDALGLALGVGLGDSVGDGVGVRVPRRQFPSTVSVYALHVVPLSSSLTTSCTISPAPRIKEYALVGFALFPASAR